MLSAQFVALYKPCKTKPIIEIFVNPIVSRVIVMQIKLYRHLNSVEHAGVLARTLPR